MTDRAVAGPVTRATAPRQRSPLIDIAQFTVLTGALVWLAVRGANSMGYNWQWYRIPRYFYEEIDGETILGPFLRGIGVTLELTAWAAVLTLAIGLVTALLRMSDSFSGRLLARVYLEAIRNTPLLVQLYLFYFVLSPIIGVDRFWTGVLTLAFYEGSFASEIFRAGIQSVARGQWEAGESIGLAGREIYRYIVLPQAVPLMLPPLTGLIISLIKHSAIVSVIAVFDLTTEGRNLIADTFLSFEIWFTIAVMYLAMTITLSVFVSYLEYRVRSRR